MVICQCSVNTSRSLESGAIQSSWILWYRNLRAGARDRWVPSLLPHNGVSWLFTTGLTTDRLEALEGKQQYTIDGSIRS
jgi:hypothetical protein